MSASMGPQDSSRDHRRRWRYLAAGLSAATALLYLLIGLKVVSVVDKVTGDAPDLLVFGLAAGSAYVMGAVLLVAFDRRVLWVVGSVFQVGVIVMYVVVSTNRTPPFEAWGISIKVLQLVLLGVLAYLSVRPPVGSPSRRPRGQLDRGAGGIG